MKVSLEGSDDDIARLMCEGPVLMDLKSAQVNPVEDAMGPGCYGKKALLNMEKSANINSTGVAWLVKCHRAFQEGGGKFVVHSLPPAVDHVLKLLNMPMLLHLAEDEHEALEKVNQE